MEDRIRKLTKYTTASIDVKNESNIKVKNEGFSEFKKKPKSTFTLVKIKDPVVDGFKEFCRLHKLESHGPLIGKILNDFLDENFPDWKESI